jgi:dTDP-4-dehydrorhamnose 3,5-epimerase
MQLDPTVKQTFHVQAYAPREVIAGVDLVDLRRHADDAGSMTELARLSEGRAQAFPDFGVRQVNYSEIEPGAIKAFHLHMRQTDVWYVPPSDRLLAVLLDARADSSTRGTCMRLMLGSGASRLLRIPPGVAHGVRNLGTSTGHVIYFTDLHFSPDPASCDEGRLSWDHLGTEVWEMTRG